ncbi:unnamed protein product [Parnassius mnemosyne]|uniref:MATH domain-containing protein n=1 Tax=Parnassius mnemosyne TaxID=213953 RepID=A0AAV1LKK9_9NEOP
MIETGSTANTTSNLLPMTTEVTNEDDDIARPEAAFRFTVQNISQLKEQVLSPPCYIRCLPWKILVLIRNTTTPDRQQQKALGVFIQCNGDCDSPGWSCYGLGEIKLLSYKPDGEHLCRKIHHMYHSKEDDWGFAHFISWTDLMDSENGFVKDDSITIEVHVVAEAPHGVSWDSKKHTGYVGN